MAEAEYLSAGIVKGASKTRQKINPEAKPVVVDPGVREEFRMVLEASGVALIAIGFLVRKLGDLSIALGKQLILYIKGQGSKLSALKKDQKEANETMDGVLTVAAGGLQGNTITDKSISETVEYGKYFKNEEDFHIYLQAQVNQEAHRRLIGYRENDDVRILVKDELFSANLAQLEASCPALADLFWCSSHILVNDCEPHIFQLFLEFLRSGSTTSLTFENIIPLFKLAKQYDVNSLKEVCLESLPLSTKSICEIIKMFIYNNEEDEMLLKALEYFKDHAEEIFDMQTWDQFLKESTNIADTLIYIFVESKENLRLSRNSYLL